MNAPMTLGDRLVKICGLFSSDHDGERSAAVAKADALLRQHGLRWRDVIGAPAPEPEPEPAPKPGRKPRREPPAWATERTVVHYLLQTWADVLTPWERRFCTSISTQTYRVTPRQRDVLDNILTKAGRYAAQARQ